MAKINSDNKTNKKSTVKTDKKAEKKAVVKNDTTTKNANKKQVNNASNNSNNNTSVLHQYKAESARLLDLMINSVYTDKSIFLRELISNASDALDKRYYHSMQGSNSLLRDDLFIELIRDEKAGILYIVDNGIGMTKSELDVNLGTIAKSGSRVFKETLNDNNSNIDKQATDNNKSEIDIIGQFGVGFYSAFMVSDKVVVTSKSIDGEVNRWESCGLEGYNITTLTTNQLSLKGDFGFERILKQDSGSIVALTLKKDTEDYKYSEFLDEYKIEELIKKHSDYIRFAIKTELSATNTSDGKELTTTELRTINSQIPIWKKQKQQITQDEYNNFYSSKFFDFEPPIATISTHIEGINEFDMLLFIPRVAPYNYYSKDYQKGLQLYASGVLISESTQSLLPDYFGFVKGVIDSADLKLNISREVLQQSKEVNLIAKTVENKIKQELLKLQKDDRDKYESFFTNFGLSIKFGAYDGFGRNKDNLIDLIMFYSNNTKKLTTLKEYVERMQKEQEWIYYAMGSTTAQIDKLPACEILKENGSEILYLTDNVDEFLIKILGDFGGKKFISVQDPKLNLNQESSEKNTKEQQENQDLLQELKKALDDKVIDVTISHRLKTHPVVLTTRGEISIEMEKTLAQMPNSGGIKAQKVLEINPLHNVWKKLISNKDNQDYIKKLAHTLYNSARLIEGLAIDDTVSFVQDLFDLI